MNQNLVDKFETERLPTGWPWRLFLFSFLLFAATVVSYFGLSLGYKPFLNRQIAGKEAEVNQLAAAVPEAEQENFIRFYSQLANLEKVLNNHVVSSALFPFLERNTNVQIYYNILDFSASEKRLTLDGVAQNYDILAQQLEAFTQAKEVERFLINESQLSEGKIRFRVSLFLAPQVLR
ncbi:MAG: hypothetical protein A2745_01585 [Candidatus Harrisonbacteria bacterium RIFCSPHIGHO2_01_FULL_44_13]|uniref:Uncharacterized protein n=1 Tax=Candidatus Harrisonbacteria bacterium RIFCSPLOWO2_01_FULL_44_18 TaxID=1798407 RepID=A0A1G1ZKL6_9BACT|nr:MAG: hypothetical protein A2745_01585 [Candidatus Harrisonbacteria bacterium RIFCSPHIGHO2_01_FULL_44_13]OGY65168.1 MAG: hypothetical protein A3A16_00545 [Candidatus Harrisonbacteria bacterium RIFCSPLOWO2_01_FULL_44_18]